MVGDVPSEQEECGFDLGPFCVGFAHSACVSAGSARVLQHFGFKKNAHEVNWEIGVWICECKWVFVLLSGPVLAWRPVMGVTMA